LLSNIFGQVRFVYNLGLETKISAYTGNKKHLSGFKPKVMKLYENLDYETAIKIEVDIISKIGRSDLNKGPLVNLTDGGEGTINMSQEIKDKISEKRKGYKHSEEAKEKMKMSRKEYFDAGNTTWNKGREWTPEERLKLTNKSNTGKKFSEEHKKKISKNSKKQMLEGSSVIKLPKIVNKYTMSGDFIEEYESIKNAALKSDIPATSIRYCCLDKLKHAGGFYWSFKK